MDDLFGLLIVALVVIVSGLSKLAEKNKEKPPQRPVQRRPRIPSDMPEATRRMLYGDEADVPMARPRGGDMTREVMPPPAQPRMAQPQTARPAAPPPPRPAPVRPAPVEEESEARRQAREAMMQLERKRRQEQERKRKQSLREEARQEAEERKRKQQEEHAKQMQARKKAPETPARSSRRPVRDARVAAPACARQGRLFSSMHDVRRGIIMQEILSPPKSLRSWDS